VSPQRNSPVDQREGEVVTVGRLYFTVSFGEGLYLQRQYHIDTRRTKTPSTSGFILYNTKEEYIKESRRVELLTKITEAVHWSNRNNISYAQAVMVAECLGIEE